MNEFIKMNTVCLKNMQMLLETISDTVNKLHDIFSIEYDNLEDYISENLTSQFIIGENYERGVMYSFGNESNYKRKYLSELQPYQEMNYSISIEENTKKKQSLDICFGYISDNKQNVIYFQLFDFLESPIITESFIVEIKSKVPQKWDCNTSGENDVYIQFEIDNDFTIDKIKECSKVFKEYILLPTINKLHQLNINVL